MTWLWEKKFIPLAEIENVEGPSEPGATFRVQRLLLRLNSGHVEEISGSGVGLGLIKAKIEGAMAVAREGKVELEALALPARGPRPVSAWVAELRELMSQEVYRMRGAPVVEDLW
ncbi:MAG: hypothetical protein MUF54_08885, partial [Polyangiaceae bacterium]|nr:hypothetical protein [Polyangiaceae bacterium]